MEEIEVQKRKPPTLKMKVEVLLRNAKCEECKCDLSDGSGEYDHILPLELGGKHEVSNLMLLCSDCHKVKTKSDVQSIREAQRRKKKIETGRGTKRKGRKLQGRGFNQKFRKKMNGEVVLRDGEKKEKDR